MQTISVNGVSILPQQIYEEMQFFPATSQEEALQSAGRALVINELLQQRARDLGLPELPEDELINQLLIQDVGQLAPTAEECRRYYTQYGEQFSSSPLAEVRHILLGVAPDDFLGRDEKRRQAEVLIKRLGSQAEDFGKLAAKFSDCPSKATGGSLGQISRGQTVPEFEKAVFRASAGLLEKPLETRYGIHIVWIERIVPGQLLPYELVSEKIRTYLGERAERRAIADYLHGLIEKARIEGIELNSDPLVQ
jgi:peptidyl-prolyl cis-trans isomerase C